MLLRTRRFSLPTTDTLSSVQREMENLFGNMLNDVSSNGTSKRSLRVPVAMWEDDGKVFLELELPGVNRETIDISVHNGVLQVRGERKAADGERKYWVNERIHGTFDQSISLPEDIDADSIDARLTDGVLYLVLTRRPEAQPKKITVHD